MGHTSRSNELGLILAHSKEYHNVEYRFFEHGFISYQRQADPAKIYWVDIFVVDYKRRKGLAFEYANTFADELKSYGITAILGTVQKAYKSYEASLEALKYWGMRQYGEDANTYYFIKEI